MLIATIVGLRGPLVELIRNRTTLANDGPPGEVVAEMIEHSRHPQTALLAAWESGKIVHREMAIREVNKIVPAAQPLPPELLDILYAGALDADQNVRESALAALQARHDPALPALAAAQLPDPDGAARLLGLNYLGQTPAAVGVPLAAGLLGDPDWRVAAKAVQLLEHWSGQNFGVKMADAVQRENAETGLLDFATNGTARIAIATAAARQWWQAHAAEFPGPKLELPAAVQAGLTRYPATDFTLRTLEGERVRLSSLRGKVVLVNFWTTWCTACVSEMPELVTLQKEHQAQLVILGVAMDYAPDDDGDQKPDPNTIPAKVARTRQQRGLNYPILLDKNVDAGSAYNGGELPTTVIIDAQGLVRRRFVGARSLAEFEGILAAARRPEAPLKLAEVTSEAALIKATLP